MKKQIHLVFALLIVVNIKCFSQSTIITPGSTEPNITATSTTNGIILPRMTNTQKNAISTLTAGMIVYDTDSNCVSVFNGVQWNCLYKNSSSSETFQIPQLTQNQINSLSLQKGELAYNTTTNGLYMSNGDKMTPSALEYLDGDEIQSSVSSDWANGGKIPVFRLRHPINTSGIIGNNSIARDFKIFPYEAGIAVEYNGVLENWVGQFSIQRGHNYFDQGDGGNGWGAILWVGDDGDTGGLRMTARNNLYYGGNLKFTEISSEGYNQNSAGNLRLRVVDSTDRIDFVGGRRGSNNIYSFIGQTGIKFPAVSNVASILSPTKGLTVFDNADSSMKVYTGAVWNDLSNHRQYGSDSINTDTILSYSGKQVKYVNASNGDITIPTVSNNLTGFIFKIIRVDNSSNSVTVVANNSNTINGITSKNIYNQFDCMSLYSRGIYEWVATREAAY